MRFWVTVIAPVPPTTLMSPLFARTVVGAMPLVKLRAAPIGTVLNLRTSASQKCEAVPEEGS